MIAYEPYQSMPGTYLSNVGGIWYSFNINVGGVTSTSTADYYLEDIIAYANWADVHVLPPKPKAKAPIMTGSAWHAAEAMSRKKTGPSHQRARFLDRELRTKTFNRRFV